MGEFMKKTIALCGVASFMSWPLTPEDLVWIKDKNNGMKKPYRDLYDGSIARL